MKTLILYTTSGCHLCEDAQALLEPVLAYFNQHAQHQVVLRTQEISESEVLVEAYGLRIPVVRLEGAESELGWPFDQAQAFAFFQQALGN